MTTGTNIFDHSIDDASTVTVEIEGTAFESLDPINDLQSCLELIDEHATSPLPDIPNASETEYGLTRLSTEAEVLDPANNETSVTPATLNVWMENHAAATESQYGFVKLITESTIDTVDPTSPVEEATNHAFTLKTLNYALDTRFQATETIRGVARFATQAQAETTGTLADNVAMTPLRTKQMLDVWANTTASSADETTKGLIRFATDAEVNLIDVSADRLAISPYRFNWRTATTTRKAGFYLPDAAAASARTSDEHAVTAGTLSLFGATPSLPGVAQLVNDLTTNDSTKALSAAMGYKLEQEKIGPAGGTINGVLQVNNIQNTSGVDLMVGGLVEPAAMLNMYPVGAIYESTSSTNPGALFGGTWTRIAQGRVLVGAGNGYTNGATGGEYAVQLTESTIPSHKHAGWGEAYGGLGWGVATKYGKNNPGSKKTDYDNYLYYSEPVGGNQSHENMQPYYVVYMWERTA